MAAIASSSSSSSASSSYVPSPCKYDVFLSFRGQDTRKNFTSHLYAALCRMKILAYIDDNLERGEEISSSLSTTIEESRLSIVIFSKNYASSRWCLDELVRIMECKEERGHIVLPVFYGVDPSDVRDQKESFAAAFVEYHKKRIKGITNEVQKWRNALTAAANLSGFHLKDELESESKFIEKIVEHVLKKLSSIPNSIDDKSPGLFGMGKHLRKMESLLCLPSLNVAWGLHGIGKTTVTIQTPTNGKMGISLKLKIPNSVVKYPKRFF